MKQLVILDPETYKRDRVLCTFELVDDKVVVEPAEALQRPHIAKVAFGSQLLTPADGKAYYDALSSLRGSYYFVEEVPIED
jgi:hypothetical protein